MSNLSFNELRHANVSRLPLFKNRKGDISHSEADGSDWTIAEWTNAIAGEVGEACNLAKKIRRGDFGSPHQSEYQSAMLELRKELADIVVYCDLASFQAGGKLGDDVINKFNEVSDRVGVEIKLVP